MAVSRRVPHLSRIVKLFATSPPPAHPPTDALLATRDAIAERKDRDRVVASTHAEHLRRLAEQEAQEQRARDTLARWRSMSEERRQWMREDCARFGREVVIGMWRRMTGDETFDLPPHE